jgi:hypothetical protein
MSELQREREELSLVAMALEVSRLEWIAGP